MTTIYYTKHFESGLLKGLNLDCSITMPDDSATVQRYAKTFRTGHKGRDIITKARYTIIDASFQNYVR